jgi:hypothetical protein
VVSPRLRLPESTRRRRGGGFKESKSDKQFLKAGLKNIASCGPTLSVWCCTSRSIANRRVLKQFFRFFSQTSNVPI